MTHSQLVRRPRHNLPSPRTALLGREQDTALVRRAILDSGGRLVTLTGTGGCGKTRLALAVAAEIGASFHEGVWLVELASLADPGLVPIAVASVLGVRDRPGRPLLESITRYLERRELLLVLDNCEHLLDACAHLADAVLRACPKLRVLATSREPLRIEGEVAWRVPSLAAPPRRSSSSLPELLQIASVQLFAHRARDAQSMFHLTEGNAATVSAICARLEGLPLAIELAAGWVRVLSVGEILTRLDSVFQVLAGGSRTGPTRQQTMWATLDWSYALLGVAERALFQRLAVFAGDWDLDAVLTISPGGEVAPDDVLRLLSRLVDTSLVQMQERAGSARYRLLEPVRDFAQHLLERSGEAHAARNAHADYYFALAKQVSLVSEGFVADMATLTRHLDRMERDHDNLRLALQWLRDNGRVESALQLANALAELWLMRGYLSEGRRWMLDLLELSGAELITRAFALGWAGNFAWSQGDPLAARALHAESLALARQCGDDVHPAYAIGALSRDALALGDYPEAERLGQEALRLCRVIGASGEAQWTLYSLGTAAYEQMDWAGAEGLLAECLASARADANASYESVAVYGLGCVAHQRGDRARAHDLLDDALSKLAEIGDRVFIAQALVSRGQLYLDEQDPARARAAFVESLEVTQELEDTVGMARCFEAFAGLAAATGRPECAWRLVGAADEIRAMCHMPRAPIDRAQLARRLEATQHPLDEKTVARLQAEGRALRVDQALALALENSGTAESGGQQSAAVHEREELTAREREVVALLARGLNNRQIAEDLVITRRTVAAHIEHILRKLGFSSRHQIAAWAVEHGLSTRRF